MVKIKKYIHDICFRYLFLKKTYISLSNFKGKIFYGIKLALPMYIFKKKNPKGLFLIFTPEHANLGDHAIAFAEKKMLDKLNISYLEVTGKQLADLDQFNLLNVMNDYFILFNGGGNLGCLWPNIEKLNRNIILNNLNSTIFILPNTIYYSLDEYGKKEFEKSKKIYNKHEKLYLYAREEISYKIMEKAYKNVKLIPDMVLSLNFCDNDLGKREGCILCLRNDVEKILSNKDYDLVLKKVNHLFKNKVTSSDTVLDYYVNISEREEELRKKFNEFKSAELVITDRLHGMIFCAITGTNCIVLNSKSPKIKGCYRWIKNLDYIQFLDNIDLIDQMYNDMVKDGKHVYNNEKILELMKELENDINKVIENRC